MQKQPEELIKDLARPFIKSTHSDVPEALFLLTNDTLITLEKGEYDIVIANKKYRDDFFQIIEKSHSNFIERGRINYAPERSAARINVMTAIVNRISKDELTNCDNMVRSILAMGYEDAHYILRPVLQMLLARENIPNRFLVSILCYLVSENNKYAPSKKEEITKCMQHKQFEVTEGIRALLHLLNLKEINDDKINSFIESLTFENVPRQKFQETLSNIFESITVFDYYSIIGRELLSKIHMLFLTSPYQTEFKVVVTAILTEAAASSTLFNNKMDAGRAAMLYQLMHYTWVDEKLKNQLVVNIMEKLASPFSAFLLACVTKADSITEIEIEKLANNNKQKLKQMLFTFIDSISRQIMNYEDYKSWVKKRQLQVDENVFFILNEIVADEDNFLRKIFNKDISKNSINENPLIKECISKRDYYICKYFYQKEARSISSRDTAQNFCRAKDEFSYIDAEFAIDEQVLKYDSFFMLNLLTNEQKEFKLYSFSQYYSDIRAFFQKRKYNNFIKLSEYNEYALKELMELKNSGFWPNEISRYELISLLKAYSQALEQQNILVLKEYVRNSEPNYRLHPFKRYPIRFSKSGESYDKIIKPIKELKREALNTVELSEYMSLFLREKLDSNDEFDFLMKEYSLSALQTAYIKYTSSLISENHSQQDDKSQNKLKLIKKYQDILDGNNPLGEHIKAVTAFPNNKDAHKTWLFFHVQRNEAIKAYLTYYCFDKVSKESVNLCNEILAGSWRVSLKNQATKVTIDEIKDTDLIQWIKDKFLQLQKVSAYPSKEADNDLMIESKTFSL